MREEILKDYFEGKINITDLFDDVIGTKVKIGAKETSFYVTSMDDNFELNVNHIIKLLRDILKYKIEPQILETIALAIEASENMQYGEALKNDLMIKMLNEWAAPEINYELNIENVKECLRRLENQTDGKTTETTGDSHHGGDRQEWVASPIDYLPNSFVVVYKLDD